MKFFDEHGKVNYEKKHANSRKARRIQININEKINKKNRYI